MSSTKRYIPNLSYSATWINQITADLGLVTSNFSDSTEYNTLNLNKISQDLVTYGVAEGCKIERYETISYDTYYNEIIIESPDVYVIQQGYLFFESGCRVDIDNEGIYFKVPITGTHYVYFYNNNNVPELLIDTSFYTQEDGDLILLGIISNGVLYDYRNFCASKVNTLGNRMNFLNDGYLLTPTFATIETFDDIGDYANSKYIFIDFEYGLGAQNVKAQITIDIVANKFSYSVITAETNKYGSLPTTIDGSTFNVSFGSGASQDLFVVILDKTAKILALEAINNWTATNNNPNQKLEIYCI